MSSHTLRLGTRASQLARWQADWVTGQLEQLGVRVEQILIATSGDQIQQGPIGAIGAQGVFTKEIQRALLDHEIDLAVHSLKDLPTDPVEGLALTAVPQRGPCGDVLVSSRYKTLDELPEGATVGTGSLRRRTQLIHRRPDLNVADIRGNVDTRLRKLDEGQFDAILLAEAGLVRLGLDDRIAQVLDRSDFLPAVGQGALGIETRVNDPKTTDWVKQLNDPDTLAAVTAERAMLFELQGGCLAPIAALGTVEGVTVHLQGRVIAPDGTRMLNAEASAAVDQAEELGRQVAATLREQGADELIRQSREM